MKRIISFFMIILATIGLAGCNNSAADPSKPGGNADGTDATQSESVDIPTENEQLEPSDTPVGFKIHFQREDGDYVKWGLYIWVDGVSTIDAGCYSFQTKDSYGGVLTEKFEDFGTDALGQKIGFIVRRVDLPENEWVKDDYDKDRFLDLATADMDKYGYYNIYIKSGEGEIFANADGRPADRIDTFFLSVDANGNYNLEGKTNNDIIGYKITQGETVLVSNDNPNDNVDAGNNFVKYSLGTEFPDLSKSLDLEVTFKDTEKVMTAACNMGVLYKTKEFNDMYNYDGELGAIYTKESTTFKVWSPVASSVTLRIYENGAPAVLPSGEAFAGGNDAHEDYPMTLGEKGVWSHTLSGDMGGKYYTYVVSNGKYKDMEVVDPYAKSAGLNGLRGMVVDFSKTNPEGWDNVHLNGRKDKELIVYETHIADVTSSDTWGGSKENQKMYTGMYEAGTRYTLGDDTVTTGFDHIKELGVNAVQILPFFDASNDERIGHRIFNWGYNPLNYNCLDGIYSKKPEDGYERIKEFKGLVKAYSEANINIIMDVVYNHTAGLARTNMDVLMPNYYYRYVNGAPANGSGCGNETASDMYMFRKFMIDSTYFWAKEYKLGGFRFDLMGLHDIETMNLLSKNLHENVDNTITVYGEPWHAGTVAIPQDKVAVQSNLPWFDGFGCFNDRSRDALMKGGMSPVSEKGWVANTSSKLRNDVATLKNGIRGFIMDPNSQRDVEKTVNYVTCHDNYTLYDRLVKAGLKDDAEMEKMAMLAQSVILTSQGINFMLAGEEFLRTKGGDHNSYASSYFINELDYSMKVFHKGMFESYKKLIALHNSTNLFCKDSNTSKHIQISVTPDCNVIYYELKDTINNRVYKIVHSNGYAGNTSRSVDLEGYTLYLDTVNKYADATVLSEATELSDFQTIIAYKQL